jgi:excisionase family DNA binding protein
MHNTEHDEESPVRRLTVRELARKIGIPLAATYKGLRSGQIPARRIGRRYVIVTEVIDRWLLCEREERSA